MLPALARPIGDTPTSAAAYQTSRRATSIVALAQVSRHRKPCHSALTRWALGGSGRNIACATTRTIPPTSHRPPRLLPDAQEGSARTDGFSYFSDANYQQEGKTNMTHTDCQILFDARKAPLEKSGLARFNGQHFVACNDKPRFDQYWKAEFHLSLVDTSPGCCFRLVSKTWRRLRASAVER